MGTHNDGFTHLLILREKSLTHALLTWRNGKTKNQSRNRRWRRTSQPPRNMPTSAPYCHLLGPLSFNVSILAIGHPSRVLSKAQRAANSCHRRPQLAKSCVKMSLSNASFQTVVYSRRS